MVKVLSSPDSRTGEAEIDAPMADAVRMLNEAGLWTNQCCQGGTERSLGCHPFVQPAHVGFCGYDANLRPLIAWAKANGYHYYRHEGAEPIVEAFDGYGHQGKREFAALRALNRRFIKDLTAWAARQLQEVKKKR